MTEDAGPGGAGPGGGGPGPAARRWGAALAEWALPDHILAGAPESPWRTPTPVFARRADESVARPSGASYRRAAEVAGDGIVLDVGSGAGAASLPLGRPIVAVDTSAEMLDALRERATRLGLPVTTVEGRWPDVAERTPVADVVVCHHVAYNAPNLDVFAAALTAHARRRVVVELTPAHPMTALTPLWRMMHGLRRPAAPTWWDAVAVLREIGHDPNVETSPRPPRPAYASFDELVAVTRRRLCLPPERDEELGLVLRDFGVNPAEPRDLTPPDDRLVTLWWDA